MSLNNVVLPAFYKIIQQFCSIMALPLSFSLHCSSLVIKARVSVYRFYSCLALRDLPLQYTDHTRMSTICGCVCVCVHFYQWRCHRLTKYNTIIELLLQTDALCHTPCHDFKTFLSLHPSQSN